MIARCLCCVNIGAPFDQDLDDVAHIVLDSLVHHLWFME